MDVLLYVAAAIPIIWGVAHFFATKGVVAGFGELSADNRRIITMEWIVEGVALISVGFFIAVATVIDSRASLARGVYAVAIAVLVVLTVVSLFTGFRIRFLPFRLCPIIFMVSAVLTVVGAWL